MMTVQPCKVKIGDIFVKLTVIEIYRDEIRWRAKCKCECGNIVDSQVAHLLSGGVQSCKCFRSSRNAYLSTTHGEGKGINRTPEYRVWESMKQRCLNPFNRSFQDYGFRGITIYDDWIDSYEKFLAYLLSSIGRRPSSDHSIDRIDNNGDYEPGNIKWSTREEQQNNTRWVKKNKL